MLYDVFLVLLLCRSHGRRVLVLTLLQLCLQLSLLLFCARQRICMRTARCLAACSLLLCLLQCLLLQSRDSTLELCLCRILLYDVFLVLLLCRSHGRSVLAFALL